MVQVVLILLNLICSLGDIKIKIPELSNILRDSIFDTKLAGTRLVFFYNLFCGVFHLTITEDIQYQIKMWVSFIAQNYDPEIDTYGSRFLNTPLSSVQTDQLTHAVVRSKPIAGVQVLVYYKKPWDKGWVLNVPRTYKLSRLY